MASEPPSKSAQRAPAVPPDQSGMSEDPAPPAGPSCASTKKTEPPLLLYGTLPAVLKPSPAEKRQLAAFSKLLSARIAGGRPFTCLIADDRELLRLNSTFLGHEYPTDVLSFPSQAGSAVAADTELGEIAISIERAAAQAREFGHAACDEIRILMLHGLLHLTGFDHEKDAGEMARAEQRWRAEFQLPETLIARQRNADEPARQRNPKAATRARSLHVHKSPAGDPAL